MKSKTPKLYVYVCNNKDFIFKAYTKKDIQKHFDITAYDIRMNCWEESSLSINVYYKDFDIIDITKESK